MLKPNVHCIINYVFRMLYAVVDINHTSVGNLVSYRFGNSWLYFELANMMNGVTEKLAFLQKVLDLLNQEHVFQQNGRRDEIPVVDFKHPDQLKKILQLSLEDDSPADIMELEKLCSLVVKYSVKTSHPNFYNQLYGGVDPYGLAGQWLSNALNTNQHTFEVAPAFTLVEQTVITHILKIVGFENGDGIFSPGGSMSNMYGVVLARFRACPEIKTKGLYCLPPLVAFTSEDAHYSLTKASHWLGFGSDNLVKIKTDEYGRMIPDELEKAIKATIASNKKPFFVNSTAGTTVLGAFDPIGDIANICEKYQLWLHVDACWGGSLILSKKYRNRLVNINRADSVSWNPHKMLGAPLQCSLFLVKHKDLLHYCNSASASYLFQGDKFYDTSYDTGDKSIQCGRKVDGFKLYLMWKARGNDGLESLVDIAMDCARYLKEKILTRRGFRLVIPEFECTNICFWYIPENLRDKEETPEWWEKIHNVAPKIKEQMVKSGSLMICYTPLPQKGLKNFFRMVTTCQPVSTYEDMDFIISNIEKYGAKLK